MFRTIVSTLALWNERRSKLPVEDKTDTGLHRESCWWAVYTRHQHEKTVATMLAAKGLEVFLPLYDSMHRWKDRSKLISLPLFPCYLFVQGGPARRLQVLTTPGVHMLLTNGEHVAKVPEVEILAIRKTLAAAIKVEPHPFLNCGQTVRVKRGPLQGVEGILIRKKNQDRLVLSVEMLAQSVAVEIDASDVESVRAFQPGLIAPRQFAGIDSFHPSRAECVAARN